MVCVVVVVADETTRDVFVVGRLCLLHSPPKKKFEKFLISSPLPIPMAHVATSEGYNLTRVANLCTGLTACAYLAHAWCCSVVGLTLARLVGVTTILYHGMHVLGRPRLAYTIMPFDVTMVALCACFMVHQTQRLEIVVSLVLCGYLWSHTFAGGVLHGLPGNPVASFIHACAWAACRKWPLCH
jgi:hypothetical protein